MKNRRLFPLLVYLLVLFLIMTWASDGLGLNRTNLSHTQLVELFQAERVKSFTIQGNLIELQLHGTYDGKDELLCSLGDPDYFLEQTEELRAAQIESGVLEDYNFLTVEATTPMDYVMPLLIAGGVLLLLWFMLMSRASAGGGGGGPMNNFGKARTVVGIPDGRKVTFADVAGADEEKAELQEVVDFLRAPARPCWPGPWPVRPRSSSCPSLALTLSRCTWAWAPAASGTCLTRPRRPPPPSSSSMRSTPWAASAVRVSAAATTRRSRH